MLVSVPTLSISIWLPIAYKFQACADYFGIIYLGSLALTMLTLNLTSPIEISSQMRNQEEGVAGLYYMIYLGLLSPNYLFNFVARILVYAACQVIVLIARS